MDDDGPPGVPEWVVTYGDMMSLLLTFFIMLVSLSEVVADKKYRAILEATQTFLGYRSGPLAPPGKKFTLNSMVEAMQDQHLGSVADTKKGTGGVKKQAPEGDDLKVTRLKEGKSQIAGQPILFKPGSVEISEAMEQQIREIARDIAGKPHKLELRSYNSPLVAGMLQTSDQLMEIGFQRAEAIRQLMLKYQIERDNMRIAVYFPRLESMSQELTESPDRVEVTIYNEFADEYIGREEDYQ